MMAMPRRGATSDNPRSGNGFLPGILVALLSDGVFFTALVVGYNESEMPDRGVSTSDQLFWAAVVIAVTGYCVAIGMTSRVGSRRLGQDMLIALTGVLFLGISLSILILFSTI